MEHRRGRPPGQFRQKAEKLFGLLKSDLQEHRLDSHEGTDKFWGERMGVSPKQAGAYIRHLRDQGRLNIVIKHVKLSPWTWSNKRSITPKEAQE